jgi:hypothetical protein
MRMAWKMAPKPESGKKLDFCGFTFGGQKLSMSGQSIFWRAQLALRIGTNNVNYWDSLDLMIRHVTLDSELAYAAAAYEISSSVRKLYSLRDSAFPNVPLFRFH